MPNIEEHLRKAIEEGKFDNLPGKGKPLHLNESNPHADPEWELAYHIIKEGGYSLPWIETIREIETDIESSRLDLHSAWSSWQAVFQHLNQAPISPWNGSAPCLPSKTSSPTSISASEITTLMYQTHASSVLS